MTKPKLKLKRKTRPKLTPKVKSEEKEEVKIFGSKVLKNKKHEMFCRYYTGPFKTFGRGQDCYMQVYYPEIKYTNDTAGDFDEKNTKHKAQASASRLLLNVIISQRCNFLMNARYNDFDVDMEMSWVMFQRSNLGAKMQAFHEYNALKKRINSNPIINIVALQLSQEEKNKIDKIYDQWKK